VVDPDDPRAPPQDLWDRLSDEQRQQIIDSLPSEFPANEAQPPEGDHHTEAVYGARTALRRFFNRGGRSIYIGTSLPVYYPARSMFSPDVMAVLDVPTHPRSSWVVSKEGKGLDLALEVLVLGHRRKDLERNVEAYAQLGIREYFVFDRPNRRLQGFRLRGFVSRNPGRTYEPIVPQNVELESEVLGLQLRIEGERLRFYASDQALPGADDLIETLEGFSEDLSRRLAAAEQRAEEEARRVAAAERRAEEEARRVAAAERRAEEETRRVAAAERRAEEAADRAAAMEARLRVALAEIERLKAER
jgi:Uma2 family endonuclease